MTKPGRGRPPRKAPRRNRLSVSASDATVAGLATLHPGRLPGAAAADILEEAITARIAPTTRAPEGSET